MAAKAVIRFAALVVAAMMIAAAPALAQTNDPNLSADRKSTASTGGDGGGRLHRGRHKGCRPAKGWITAAKGPAQVPPRLVQCFFPTLIVDLFPNPAGDGQAPLPTPDPRRDPASGALPPPVPPAGAAAIQQAAAAGGPIVSPSDLVAAEPPRAIVGDFVPDEVLVTVDGGADASEIAACFGLEVRSQRQSQLLGATMVRFGIPDGRPVGVVLAQLAADGRHLAARAQPYLLAAAGRRHRQLCLQAHRARCERGERRERAHRRRRHRHRRYQSGTLRRHRRSVRRHARRADRGARSRHLDRRPDRRRRRAQRHGAGRQDLSRPRLRGRQVDHGRHPCGARLGGGAGCPHHQYELRRPEERPARRRLPQCPRPRHRAGRRRRQQRTEGALRLSGRLSTASSR